MRQTSSTKHESEMPSPPLIMIVDDDMDTLRFVGFLLQNAHYEVVASNSGRQTLSILNSMTRLPDLILLDIMMPDMDGYDIAKNIRSNPRFNHILILFVSAKALPEDRTKALSSGGNDYLGKSANPRDLLSRIRSLLDPSTRNPAPTTATATELETDKANTTNSDEQLFSENTESQKLPIKPQQSPQTASENTSAALIMTVDDDIDSLKFIELPLVRAGYNITAANSGTLALKKLDSESRLPDLIILDVMMADMDGYELFERIRAQPRLNHIPVMFLSAKARIEDRVRGYEAGIDVYLTKPIYPSELLSHVRALLRRNEFDLINITDKFYEHENRVHFQEASARRIAVIPPLIWVVNDDRFLRDFLIERLQNGGYDVAGFDFGSDVLKSLTSNKQLPNIILLDVIMPARDGYELLKTIKSNSELKHIFVIILTAKSDLESIAAGVELDADDYITKPILFYQVLLSINRLLKRLQVDIDKKEKGNNIPSLTDATNIIPPLIWVVDDEPNIIDTVTELLNFEGYDVVSFSNGLEVVEALHTSNSLPNIVTLDVMMPALNGYEVLRIIRSDPRLKHIFVIILSAKSSRYDIGYGLNLGADDSLSKPYTDEELLSSVESLLRRLEADTPNEIKNIRLINIFNTSRKTIEKNFSEYSINIYNSEFADGLWSSIAGWEPNIIFLELTSEVHNQVSILRNFCLSSFLPIVIISEQYPSFDLVLKLITLGADEVITINPEVAIAAMKTLIKQYTLPPLIEIGDPWEVLIASPDANLCNLVTDTLKSSFYVNVVLEHIDYNLIRYKLSHKQHLNLLIIDEAIGGIGLISKLRQNGITAPVILLINSITLITIDHLKLNIRGLVPYSFIRDGINVIIQKLLRRHQSIRTITEYWAEYQIQTSEAEFKRLLTKNAPTIAALYAEMGARYSGLIHDLRNAIGLMEGRLRRIDDAKDLKTTVHLASMFLELIAEARFKSIWSPTEHSSIKIHGILESTINNVKYARPQCLIKFMSLTHYPTLILDARQIEQALTALLLTIAATTTNIEISVNFTEDSFHINIEYLNSSLEVPVSIAEAVSNEDAIDLYMLTALKLLNRHQAKLDRKNGVLTITLPTGGWRSEKAVRMDIATLFYEEKEILKEFDKLDLLPELNILGSLVNQPLSELMFWCEKITYFAQPYGEKLLKISRYAVLLVRDMLYVSVGYTSPTYSLNVRSVIDTLLELRGDRLGQCKLTIQVEENLPPVQAEELGLLQILVNLTTNAVEAMNGKGDLAISAKLESNHIRVEVSDSGAGIPLTEQTKLFDLFHTTKQGHERGVGLYIVKTLVDQFNGSILLQSKEGIGTKFSILLPTAET